MTGRIVVIGATGQIGRPAGAVIHLAGGPLFDGRRHSRGDVEAESRVRAGALGHLVTALGRGWTPWVHIADEVGIIAFALQRPEAGGPVNLTAPQPVTAREFARALGRVLGHRAWLPAPAPFVRMGLGAVTDILTRGKRVLPAKVSAAGYQFRFPSLDPALRDVIHGELVP